MRKPAPTRMDRDDARFLSRVMTMGAGTNLPVVMQPSELARLIGLIYRDNGKGPELEAEHPGLWEQIDPGQDYYDIPESWFLKPVQLSQGQHAALFITGMQQIEDFKTYLRCLSELHKRRRKYSLILQAQPMPTMVQVSPRALIEYGHVAPQELASWLTWRKFFYDLDNRAAQETGYLFEPILAAAIGGEPQGPRTLVVRRTGEPSKGRQVDCWKITPDGVSKPLAYEFKLRVTIAASGQGRFAEEISFAEDAKNSNATPVLLVLDPTMNPRLAELQAAYEARGGHAYLGEAAWQHLENEAGSTMARFIESYVRQPIKAISLFEQQRVEQGHEGLHLLPLNASYSGDQLRLKLGSVERLVTRREDSSLTDDGDTPPV
jgi:hypothetical protein